MHADNVTLLTDLQMVQVALISPQVQIIINVMTEPLPQIQKD